ncbi:hypothetical protein K435DRAFT_794853 [Dendrothele bispora CBS 962.96]|uniref:Uncharacterized protein n=1 Tax=Dendrothele bispora (strain CBS 962.96) TaxID=1314807 RepID=A0A4S8LB01_DENBC|nr:hypothetical protein K435DRAFT_805878 [Dendrothele bispora CBS 962.96]THU99602.1 hypothetical protein K435DRAFT_794853 [Dendrothele bispora CBS 962.96]
MAWWLPARRKVKKFCRAETVTEMLISINAEWRKDNPRITLLSEKLEKRSRYFGYHKEVIIQKAMSENKSKKDRYKYDIQKNLGHQSLSKSKEGKMKNKYEVKKEKIMKWCIDMLGHMMYKA